MGVRAEKQEAPHWAGLGESPLMRRRGHLTVSGGDLSMSAKIVSTPSMDCSESMLLNPSNGTRDRPANLTPADTSAPAPNPSRWA
jgi:hypothetical protein